MIDIQVFDPVICPKCRKLRGDKLFFVAADEDYGNLCHCPHDPLETTGTESCWQKKKKVSSDRSIKENAEVWKELADV